MKRKIKYFSGLLIGALAMFLWITMNEIPNNQIEQPTNTIAMNEHEQQFDSLKEQQVEVERLLPLHEHKASGANEVDFQQLAQTTTADSALLKTQKVVALTFDDGPHSVHTDRILRILADYNIRATFFMLGSMVEKHPNVAQAVVAQGHQIGNHSWNHKNFQKLTIEQVQNDLKKTSAKIVEVTSVSPTIYRPPYGSTNAAIRNATALEEVLWSVDTLDWKTRDPQKILNEVKRQVHPNANILLHDIHETSADAVRPIVKFLLKEGYVFVTVDELLLLEENE
jgi:peptidoglycan-N-acetylglucosamine deacetylase